MGLLDRARLSLAKKLVPMRKQAGRGRASFELAWPKYYLGNPQWQSIDYGSYTYHGYEINAVVFSAIAYKQRSIAGAPLTAFQGDPLDAVIAPIDHPLQRLADRPNPVQTGIELVQLLDCHYNIAGNAFCVIAREGQTVKGLYALRPDRVFIVPQDKGTVTYWYQPDGVQAYDIQNYIPILADDMIHLKVPNPRDPLEGFGYGVSPLTSAGRSIDVHNDVTAYLKLFFEHAAVPPGQITFDTPQSQDALENAKEAWMEKHGGYEAWPEPAVFDAGGKYEPISMPFKDMAFEGIDTRNETLVLATLGVPPILIGVRSGLEHATYSNYREARQAFCEDTLVPELMQFGGEFQRVRDGDAWLGFDFSSVPSLIERNMTRAQTFDVLYAQGMGAYPSDQAAQIAGLPAPQWPEKEEPPTPAPTGETIAEEQGEEVPEKMTLLPLWTEDTIAVRQRVLAIIDDEARAALKAGRSLDWRAIKRQWEDLTLALAYGGEWGRMLVAMADFAYNEVLTADQVRIRLQHAWGERGGGH
jgi:HK97 family phage portal protein